MIEKIIHVFLDNNELSRTQKITIEDNKKILNDYKFVIWSKFKIELFMKHLDINDKKLVNYLIVCCLGGFLVDIDYVFLKKIDVFLEHNCLAVFNGSKIKFFGSRKNNNMIIDSLENNGKFDELSLRKMKVKIINPIYLYPEIKSDYSTIVECNKDYIFGANKKDSSWIFTKKINEIKSSFRYNIKKYKFNSNFIIKKITRKNDILIVVAHPDDDLLWFGDFIIKNCQKVKVLCITNSSNKIRRSEFQKIMDKINVDYEMWDSCDIKSYDNFPELKKKLSNEIINYNMILTHSLSGETGHPTHILLSKILFDVVEKNLYVANLYNNSKQMSDIKNNLLKIYGSQYGKIKKYLYFSKKEDILRIK